MKFTWSDYLVDLVARVEAAAARLGAATPPEIAALAPHARREAARLSARLDASPLEEDTAARVDAEGEARFVQLAPPFVASHRAGGWERALKLEGMSTQEVAAVEYANLLRGHDRESELAEVFFEQPLGAIHALHAEICRGLVASETIGQPRRTEQAIHDGAQGRVVYHASPAERVPALLAGLVDWLGEGSATLPAIVVSGIVHERILEWQPFEAANGRLARALSRLVLRARGTDPAGVAVPERVWARDPLAYYAEVAATLRRRGDLGGWLERHGEAVAIALDAAADAVRPQAAPRAPARAEEFLAGLAPGDRLTLAEYVSRVGVSRDTARRELALLAGSGRVQLEPGTRGLRYRVQSNRPNGQG